MYRLMTPLDAAAYYWWLAEKYDITFKEAIAHDDRTNCKDWPEYAATLEDTNNEI